MWKTDYQSQSPCGNAKTVLVNFFVLSNFGQFDYELETRLGKPLPSTASTVLCCRQIVTDDHVATIYEAY